MKLKHRLSLFSVLTFSIISLIIAVIIYIAYYFQMEKLEQSSLESKTLLAAIYYLEKDELSTVEHENIHNRLQKTISRRNIAIFDSTGVKVDGNMSSVMDISAAFLRQVEVSGRGNFSTSDYFYNGIFYEDNQGNFVIIARENKSDFNAQIYSLLQVLALSFLLGILIIYLFSRYLGNVAYQPIIDVISQIKERDSKNFEKPLALDRSYSEIQDLVNTYNHFVDRIAQTFNVQKNFIDYVSHEIRTPITAILGTLEVTDQKNRTQAEYDEVIQQLKRFTLDLQETMDHMMLLSGAKTNFDFEKVRMDEIVWQVIENAILYHQAKITVDMEVKDPALLLWEGNDKLLALAINNIIENAIKYSNNQPIDVLFKEVDRHLVISIIDRGIGIPSEELKQVKRNFFRASNSKDFNGKGIGLSMANIIFNLHHIELDIIRKPKGIAVDLIF